MQEVWVIKNKETREVWKTRKGKTSWSKKSSAKNSFNWSPPTRYKRFDDQDQYEIVQVGYPTDWKKKYEDLVNHINYLDSCNRLSALGCGLEDNDITCRYEAADYGWFNCIEAITEGLEEE